MTQANTQTAPRRPNYFVLLGLNPDKPWDVALFQVALRDRRNEWSRLQNNVGQKALLARRNLRLIPEIEAIMADDRLRQAEADEARALYAAQRQQRLEEFEKQILFLNAKNAIDEREMEQFILDFQDVYARDEIRQRITIPVAAPADVGAGPPLLAATLFKSIQELLSFLNRESLYDFLELPAATDSQELSRVAEALYQREVQRVPKTDLVTARTELAGHARHIFSKEETRRQYDESLRQRSIDRLLDDLETIMSRVSNKELQAGQVNLFLAHAQQAGWSHDEAYARLLERARVRKWYLEPAGVEHRVRCQKCNALNRSHQKLCSSCGFELAIACPNCSEQVPSKDRVCGHCGFAVGNRVLVEQRLQELEQLLDAQRFEQAYALLRSLTALWTPSRPDVLAGRIQEKKARLDRYRQNQQEEQRNLEGQFASLIRSKRLYEAKSFLQQHGPDITNAAQHQATITQSLTRAEIMRKRLEQTQHSLNQDEHIARYLDIEDICRDLPGLDRLRMPPAPPEQLRASVQGSIVRLSWQPSPTAHVSYTLLRKELARPNSLQDGLEVATNVAGCSYDDDAAAVAGVPLYYAVYSGYSEVRSPTGAVLAQPVMVTQSVARVQVQTGDRLVELQWETPPRTYSVLVVRSEQGPPASAADGIQVGEYRPAQQQCTDTHVQNGQTYYYALYSQFKNQQGRYVRAEAEHITATPDIPPGPPGPLTIQSTQHEQGYEVVLCWTPPARGRVEIYRTDSAFARPYGTVLPETEVILYGTKLGQVQNQVVESWPAPGTACYTPVLIYQGMAYVGACQQFACVENLSRLEIQNLGDRLQFKWRWPAGCQEVVIVYSKTDWPGPGVADTVKERVSLARYERAGCWYLQGTDDQEYFVSLTAMLLVEQHRVAAAEIRRHVRQKRLLEIMYEIRPTGLLHRKPALCISVNRLVALPALLLVARRDRLPWKKDDGDVIKTLAPRRLTRLTFAIDLDERAYQPATFARLFLEDGQLTDWIQINTPDKEKLRLR